MFQSDEGQKWSAGSERGDVMLRKIDLMHHLFGEVQDKKCKDCDNLVSYTASHKWYKCKCYSIGSSEASDWRLKYTACGLFNKPYDGNPVIKMVKWVKPKEDDQIEGQVSLFD